MNRKHLTLNDICIGDYVHEWLEIPEKWGPPMFVDGIFKDGDIYLNIIGNEADPFDANIRNIHDIPIDFGILPHFGFFEIDHHRYQLEHKGWKLSLDVYKPFEHFVVNAMLVCDTDKCKTYMSKRSLDSIRSLQHWFYEVTGTPLELDFE